MRVLDCFSRRTAVLLLAVAVGSAGCAGTRAKDDEDTVRALTPDVAVSSLGMVAASAPEATSAGRDVLAAGGNAMDAAVAVALALGVADPGDSGLGGGTYILVHMADGRTAAIDGSTPFPLAIDREELISLRAKGVVAAAQMAAVPATLAALDAGREAFGTMSLADLLAPSIAIAENGYATTQFQRAVATQYFEDVLSSDVLRWIILRKGTRLPPVGYRIVRPDLARTLRRIAAGGAAEFYRGSIADEIEADMIRRGGYIRRKDLEMLRIPVRRPVQGTYRGREVLSFPSPGGGGAVIEALNILERFPETLLREDSADRLQVFADACRLATEDNRRATADPNLPEALQDRRNLEKSFAARRATLIVPGKPLPADALEPVPSFSTPDRQTVEISVVDRWGNAVALTQTLYRFYGNKVITRGLGFVYNSGLEAYDPGQQSSVRPHAIMPTDMAPTIVLEDGRPLLVLGSAASTRIAAAIAAVITNVVDRGMGPAEAVAAPRVMWCAGDSNGVTVETMPPVTEAMADALAARGLPVGRRIPLPSPLLTVAADGAVNTVYRDPATGLLTGVGDPRRCGTARGVEAPPAP